MFRNLLMLLKKTDLTRAETTWILRTVFKISFWFQTSLAIIIFPIALIIIIQIPNKVNSIIGPTLLITDLLLLPIALLTTSFFNVKTEIKGVLASVICFATLLATSVWLLLFAYLIGVNGIFLISLLLISFGYYALGLKLAGHYDVIAKLVLIYLSYFIDLFRQLLLRCRLFLRKKLDRIIKIFSK